jgi:hypothetical protein
MSEDKFIGGRDGLGQEVMLRGATVALRVEQT